MHFPSGNDFVGAREWVTVGVRPHPGGSLLAAEVEIYEDNQFVGSQPLAASSPKGHRQWGGTSSEARLNVCLPVERSNLLATGMPTNVVKIESTRESSTTMVIISFIYEYLSGHSRILYNVKH